MADLENVNYSVDESIARIEMNRPERHNALDFGLLDDLDAAFTLAEEDDAVHAIVLSGAGRSFCSGYDLGGTYYITPPEDGWDRGSALMRLRGIEGRYQRIWNCPKPTIAQIHGHCLAGGCYLQMVCDISIAADDAVLGHPAGGGGAVTSMPLWQILLGPKRARDLLFTGRLISGGEAERIGLVSRSVPGSALAATVDEIAATLAQVPFGGMLAAKEMLNTAMEVQGLGALFRYHGQMNAMARLEPQKDNG